MSTNIYLFKSGQQRGPYRVEDIKELLRSRKISPTSMAHFDENCNWVPVFCIPEIREDLSLTASTKAATSGDAGIELAIVESTTREIGNLIEQLSQAAGNENKNLYDTIQRRMLVLWRQIYTYKAQFPDTTEAKALEAAYYRLQALIRFNAAGFLRRQSQQATNLVWGVVTGLLASKQEKTNAQEALAFLDQAISAYDNAEDRLKKAYIYRLLGQHEDALQELERIMVSWPPQENLQEYIEARQLRDAIEAAR